MTEFILNEKIVATDLPSGMTLLDFIRYQQHLMGTKIGCREGDCGACTILSGTLKNGVMQYTSATSCLMPLGNAQGKHIVTIEGINIAGNGQDKLLSPIQQAMADEGATQCGFCTPGFVVSLTGFCLGDPSSQNITASIDGNICRCTGYKSIQRSADRILNLLERRKNITPVDFAVQNNIVPAYFTTIKDKIHVILSRSNGTPPSEMDIFLGGGTDLYVQKHDEIKDARIHFLLDKKNMKEIRQDGQTCIIGGSATVTDLKESAIMQKHFPRLDEYIKLVSSTPIRNMATIAGNFVNGSPIGDFTIFFLALNAQLLISDGKRTRTLPLTKLYKGYKTLDKKPEEYIEQISFVLPDRQSQFHFEKVSKRKHLDIASVNSAILIKKDKRMVFDAGISAGGVGPVPLFLDKTSTFLKGKIMAEEVVHKCIEIAQTEISPISDARGSASYKRFLLGQLIKAHFLQLFPELDVEKILSG